MYKKIVFFDIDGTLWGRDNDIPPSAIEAIKKLQENGHYAFINTGRCRSFVRNRTLLDIGFDGIVSGCGTMIEKGDEVLFYYTVDNDIIANAIKTVRSFSFRPILEGRYNLYFDDEDFADDPFGKFVLKEMAEDVLPIEENWGKWEVSKLSCAVDDGHIEECRQVIGGDFDFMVHNPEVIELVPKGFHKGIGIERTCELMGIPISDTICFGDSPNDIEMFDTAGFGVAMGNGSDIIKEMSDHVTADYDDDGIYKGLKHLGLI